MPTRWARYKVQPSFVLGFHGCDAATAEKVFAGQEPLRTSRNKWDWLGNGIYFWEGSPQRALEWAIEAIARNGKGSGVVLEPAVVGAIIDLGACCNLFDSASLEQLATAHEVFVEAMQQRSLPMPLNTGGGTDKPLRKLDCAVIETMHQLRQMEGLPDYDTVRAAFGEGAPLYPGAGLTERNHIQIAVRNPACIKGYFRPLEG